MNLFKNFDLNFSLTIIGLILAFIGIYIAIKSKKKVRFELYSLNNFTLINAKLLNLGFLKIKNNLNKKHAIHELVLFFKNSGNTTLSSSDIIKNISFKFDSKEISNLETTCYSSNKYSKIKLINSNDKIVEFSFNNLEPNDFLKINIKYSDKNQVTGKIKGKIKEAPEINNEISAETYDDILYAGSYWTSDMNFVFIAFSLIFIVQVIVLLKILNIDLETVYRTFDKNLLQNIQSTESWILFGFAIIFLLISYYLIKPLKKAITPNNWIISNIKEWYKNDECYRK